MVEGGGRSPLHVLPAQLPLSGLTMHIPNRAGAPTFIFRGDDAGADAPKRRPGGTDFSARVTTAQVALIASAPVLNVNNLEANSGHEGAVDPMSRLAVDADKMIPPPLPDDDDDDINPRWAKRVRNADDAPAEVQAETQDGAEPGDGDDGDADSLPSASE